jgi:hypothetical protein
MICYTELPSSPSRFLSDTIFRRKTSNEARIQAKKYQSSKKSSRRGNDD